MMPIKNYILDTNVLINDPKSIFRFKENNVYIPIYVLEELDGLKNDPSEKGRSAREAIRHLDDFRYRGNLVDGIRINDGGLLYVYSPSNRVGPLNSVKDSVDNYILQVALDIACESELKTILVTMDINLRVRAESLGIQVAPYEYQSVDISTLNNGVIDLEVSKEEIDNFYNNKILHLDQDTIDEYNIEQNSCVRLICNNSSALARFKKVQDSYLSALQPLNIPKSIFGLLPKNKGQNFALDLLMDDNIKLVTIMGNAGTGKTILALSAALQQLSEGQYNKILVSRPVVPMGGRDIGYLPGSISEKLEPWMKPIYDNLDYLMITGGKKNKVTSEELFNNKQIEIEPLTYIRGRSIPNQFILIDESQNLNINEVKTIISRCGENTKIILTGDINQIDNPYVSKSTNGLSVVVKKMHNNPLVGHIALEKGERSALATLAADLL